MRILYVDLEREWRGGQSQALFTVRGLRERALQAELVAARDSPLAIRSREAGIPVHEIPRLGLRARAAVAIRKLLAERSFDLVHVNEPHALTAAWLAGAHKRMPLLVSRRVAYPLKKGRFSRARYRAAQRILAISDFVQKSVVDSGFAPEKLDLVYEGVEMPPPVSVEARGRARLRWGVREQQTLFGCVGYLLPEKGQELIVRAFPTVHAGFPGAHLLFAGDGPCRPRLEALVREHKLGDTVTFAGFIRDIPEVYAALDAFVFSSHAEPLGTSLLAAMAWGLPVVAVATGGVPEYVEHGVTGLLASHPDPRLLSVEMLKLLNDAEFAKGLGTAARATIQKRFTADHMVVKTIRVYEDALKERKCV